MPKVKPIKGAVKAYQYKIVTPPKVEFHHDRPQIMEDGEVLDKIVQGKRASDLEERFAKALDKNANVSSYEFIVHNVVGRNLPGEVQLDFAVYAPLLYPIQIDGPFAHKNAAQRENDRMKDAILDEFLKGYAAAPVKRITDERLHTQAQADELVKELF
jgi:hypothetical protein